VIGLLVFLAGAVYYKRAALFGKPTNDDKADPLLANDGLQSAGHQKMSHETQEMTSLASTSVSPMTSLASTSVSPPEASNRQNSSGLAINATFDANEIPYEHIRKFTNTFAEVLGKGAFATVFKGVMYRQEVAVKVDHEVKDEKMRKFIKHQFVDEINILYKYKHDNLCMLLAHSIDGPTRCLVYEICHNGSIWDRVRDPQAPVLTWLQRLSLALGSTKALAYLHTFTPPAVHRDIKSPNILITADYQAKVSDFGTMREMAKTDTSVTSMETRQVIGTQHYMPPE
jgi:hypothetical protein